MGEAERSRLVPTGTSPPRPGRPLASATRDPGMAAHRVSALARPAAAAPLRPHRSRQRRPGATPGWKRWASGVRTRPCVAGRI